MDKKKQLRQEFEKDFEKFRHGLFRASLDHWLETGKLSGSFMLEINNFYSKLSQKEQEIDRLKKEREPISELLAILHRDGGHYQEKHGLEKAIKDAIELIHTEWVNKDEVDRLKKQSCELWTLWESLAEAGQISVGERFTKRYNELKEELEELKNNLPNE